MKKGYTRICKNRDMWFTFIPVTVKEVLEKLGFKVGDKVYWFLRQISKDTVRIEIEITKKETIEVNI